jgi:TRAP transporter TAXI family solute receptor
MDREQYQQIAVGAATVGIVAALASGRLPRWLRVILVAGLALIAAGAGVYAYRYTKMPTTLTVAAPDGDATRLISAIAARISASGSPVRLKVADKASPTDVVKALSAGDVDLAIVRADGGGDLSDARTVVTITHAVVLIVVPPGGGVESIEELKGKTVGVLAADLNRQIVALISREYDLERAKVHFKDLTLADLPNAIKSKQVQAVLVVIPITERSLSMLRNALPRNAKQKPGLVAIESAGAIAEIARAYESYDLPKGTLLGSPPIPDDDLTTLRVPYYLLAKRKLRDDTVTALVKAIMDARRDLLGEYPILAQMSAPDTDKDALIPVHPGAAAYFDGDEKSIFDKYGDQFFYGSMLLGSLMSLLAATWKFMTKDPAPTAKGPSMQIHALIADVNAAQNQAELAAIEYKINDVLKNELERYTSGDIEAGQATALNLAIHRLEYLMGQRRMTLNSSAAAPPQ